MRTLYVFATHIEAQALIDESTTRATDNPDLFNLPDGSLLITGMGAVAATSAVAVHGVYYDRVVGLGICGGLDTTLPIHSVHCCSQVTHAIGQPSPHLAAMMQRSLGPLCIQTEGLHLATVSEPVYGEQKRDYLFEKGFHLVDMEGFGIARAAQDLGKPCELIRVISDHCTPDTSRRIREYLPMLSTLLASRASRAPT